MKSNLHRHFPNITIPEFQNNSECPTEWTDVYLDAANKLSKNDLKKNNYRLMAWLLDMKSFKPFQYKLITEDFVFEPDMIEETDNILKNLSQHFENNTRIENVVFVSVHVRRTDYADWMKKIVQGALTSSKYFLTAMDMMRKKYNANSTNILFLMASDDPQWCKQEFGNLSDVVLTSEIQSKFANQQPTLDFSLMSKCNHSIFRYIFLKMFSSFLVREILE